MPRRTFERYNYVSPPKINWEGLTNAHDRIFDLIHSLSFYLSNPLKEKVLPACKVFDIATQDLAAVQAGKKDEPLYYETTALRYGPSYFMSLSDSYKGSIALLQAMIAARKLPGSIQLQKITETSRSSTFRDTEKEVIHIFLDEEEVEKFIKTLEKVVSLNGGMLAKEAYQIIVDQDKPYDFTKLAKQVGTFNIAQTPIIRLIEDLCSTYEASRMSAGHDNNVSVYSALKDTYGDHYRLTFDDRFRVVYTLLEELFARRIIPGAFTIERYPVSRLSETGSKCLGLYEYSGKGANFQTLYSLHLGTYEIGDFCQKLEAILQENDRDIFVFLAQDVNSRLSLQESFGRHSQDFYGAQFHPAILARLEQVGLGLDNL